MRLKSGTFSRLYVGMWRLGSTVHWSNVRFAACQVAIHGSLSCMTYASWNLKFGIKSVLASSHRFYLSYKKLHFIADSPLFLTYTFYRWILSPSSFSYYRFYHFCSNSVHCHHSFWLILSSPILGTNSLFVMMCR